jgi:putative transposase
LPQVFPTGNGAELCGPAMLTWAHDLGSPSALIEPSKLTQNAYIEPFNARFRVGGLNEHWLTRLAHAQAAIET